MTTNLLNKIAAVPAFVIGAMAVFAGGKLLLGSLPGYYVVDWLPVYNYVMSLVSIFFSSVAIWKNTGLPIPQPPGHSARTPSSC